MSKTEILQLCEVEVYAEGNVHHLKEAHFSMKNSKANDLISRIKFN